MPIFTDVSTNRIFLDLQNPRHKVLESEAQAIDYLCKEEDLYPLARDIAKFGLSPMERFALIAVENEETESKSYYVAEGNRRICAIKLKLLNNPELSHPNLHHLQNLLK